MKGKTDLLHVVRAPTGQPRPDNLEPRFYNPVMTTSNLGVATYTLANSQPATSPSYAGYPDLAAAAARRPAIYDLKPRPRPRSEITSNMNRPL